MPSWTLGVSPRTISDRLAWWISFVVGAAGMTLVLAVAALNWLLVLWLLGLFEPETTSPLV